MPRFIILRFLSMIPVLLLVTVAVFLVGAAIPGDPALVLLGRDATPEQLEIARRNYGLDKPLPVQYVNWLSHAIRGDLGVSYFSQVPVTELISRALPVTVQLLAFATGLALLISIPMALASALHRNTWIDAFARITSFAGLSVPSFWLGILLVSLFSVRLGWLPASGYVPLGESPVDWFKSLLLPAITLAVIMSAGLTRYLRASLLDVLSRDYIQTATSKGLSRQTILRRHVMRNALIPFVTVLGLAMAGLLGGAFVIEQLFALPGMGRLGVDAILARDYRVMQGVVLVVATGYVVMNFLVDVLYGVLDPRLRVGGE